MVESQVVGITPAQHADEHSVGGSDPLVNPLLLHAARHALGGADALTTQYFNTQAVVTGSRAIDTTYQNTSGYPMLVLIRSGAVGSGSVYCDAATPPTTEIGYLAANQNISFIVPVDYYYKKAGGGISRWIEYTTV